jgi:hypothetical protein
MDYRNGMTWNDTFLALFERSVAHYQSGNRDFESHYGPEDRAFLAGIGYQTREFFDYVEDFCEEGLPSASTALLITAVRRDYFLSMPPEAPGTPRLSPNDLPGFGEEVAGIAYLPRIGAKARGKLHGTLDPDVMFGCGGDRNFLRIHGDINPADFLRRVWAAGDDMQKLAAWVSAQGA